jgi:hypothetical protein
VKSSGGISEEWRTLSDLWCFDTGIFEGNAWSEVSPVSTVSMYGIYGHRAVNWQRHSIVGYGASSDNAAGQEVQTHKT